jgi:hypothetical protein
MLVFWENGWGRTSSWQTFVTDRAWKSNRLGSVSGDVGAAENASSPRPMRGQGKGKDEIQGSLHSATDDDAVRRCGRDDVFFEEGTVLCVERTGALRREDPRLRGRIRCRRKGLAGGLGLWDVVLPAAGCVTRPCSRLSSRRRRGRWGRSCAGIGRGRCTRRW